MLAQRIRHSRYEDIATFQKRAIGATALDCVRNETIYHDNNHR